MTLSDERLSAATLQAEGTIGIVDIGPLTCENGAVIDDVSIAVQRWGELSPNRDNVVVVLHALTGDSNVEGWWNASLVRAPRSTPTGGARLRPTSWVDAADPPGPVRCAATESLGVQGFR